MRMLWEGWVVLLVAAGILYALQRYRNAPADLLFLGALAVLTLLGILTPEDALSGFANPAVLTIGALFVAAAGLRSTGVLDWVGHRLLGSAQSDASALRRMALSVVPASAFIPNTPVVAMMVPVVVDWCRKRRISPSRLLIPVSYLSILGGICTLIGTSTTLIVHGMLQSEYSRTELHDERFRHELRPMGLFEIGRVGVPCALLGTGLIVLLRRRLLPDRKKLVEQLGEHAREYLVEMLVRPECRLIGQTVEQAGLRHLPGLFLIEINRGDEIITPVTPQDVIHDGDRLVFTGVVTTIVDLERIAGLVPAADMAYEFHPTKRQQRHLTEAVLSRTSPVIGVTVRQANFRQLYGAAIVAVHRNGVRLTNKIGDIVLQPGDTLLLQTRDDFVETFRHNRDFYLVSGVDGSTPMRHDRAPLAMLLMLVLVLWLSVGSWFTPAQWQGWFPHWNWAGLTSPAVASLTIAVLMVLTRCLPVAQARSALDLQVLVTIAAALGLGRALSRSGAAEALADGMVELVGSHPYVLLIVIYLLAALFTELVTNNAVAAMLFPIAVALAAAGGYSPRPFVMAITVAASVSLMTPVGYQTNLMVMGPGGYHPRDYLRAGWPLALLVGATALLLIPYAWPFVIGSNLPTQP